jgi:cell division protein FtsB
MSIGLESRRGAPRSAMPGWLGLKRTTVGLGLALLVVGWGLTGEYLRDREMQREIDRLEARATEMAAKNRELEETGSTVSSEALLEREARLKMNLQKPGEQVVVVQGGAPQPRAEAAAAEAEAGAPTNAAKWWRHFFR